MSSLKAFAPVASGIGKAVESSVDTIMQIAGYIADECEKLDEMKKAIIKRMEAGEDLTLEQEETLGIKYYHKIYRYQIGWQPNIILKLHNMFAEDFFDVERYFFLEYGIYTYKGKTYFSPKNFEVSQATPPLDKDIFLYSYFYKKQFYPLIVGVKVATAKEEEILPGFKLPREIAISVNYSTSDDDLLSSKKTGPKNGKAILWLSANSKKPKIIMYEGDFVLKNAEI